MLVRHTVFVFLFSVTFLCKDIQAGPVKQHQVRRLRSSRMVREVYPPETEQPTDNEGNQAQVCIVGDVVYGIDEAVPADQPCLKCKCQPPGVQCETLQCVKKSGCKAIHKPNKCCPEYQCECEHNGKFYANGEKLETPPGGECRVCYCRGGEVQCAEVSCYIRKDCEGKRVAGTCCPKYDHCPPIDSMINNRTTQHTTPTVPMEPWSVIPLNSTDSNSELTSEDLQNENNIPDTIYLESTTALYQRSDFEEKPKITIQEIIPERKEIPVTAPPKVEKQPQHGTLLIEEANNSNDLVTDPDGDFSEISETYQHPPPVLKIGDRLWSVKKGQFVHENDTATPNSVITVVGAEGLQRGFEESAEINDPKSSNTTESSENTTATDELRTEGASLSTAASTHILSLVKRKNQPPSTTETAPPTTEVFHEPLSSTTEIITNSSDEATTEESKNSETTSTAAPMTTHAKHYEPITDQNPAYPPLPEILSPNIDDTSQRFDLEVNEGLVENTTVSKILTDILTNVTLPENTTNVEWLKTNTDTLINLRASLPDEVLNQPDELVGTTETETTSTLGTKSAESLETSSEDSGERVTPKSNHAQILSNENASIEMKKEGEADDMVGMKERSNDVSLEKSSSKEVKLIDSVDEIRKNESTTKAADVEIIDTTTLLKVKPIEKMDAPLKIIKRESSDDEVFKDLDKELSEEQTDRNVSSDEEQRESDAIFKELLEESSTQKAQSREVDALSRVTNALAQFSLKGREPDTNILGILSNFFSSQYNQ